MKGKVLFLVFSFLLMAGCGSGYEGLIEDTTGYVEDEILAGSDKGLDVRENSSICVWDDGRYIGVEMIGEDAPSGDYLFDMSNDGYDRITGSDKDDLMEREPDYCEQFGEEI
ncbi:hypothetical protein [Virgibacillus salexigens]|uniref:DUF4467 domain-containing protein n=1 Tax=Virgibacillus kapii TaxID=1638645 RepID=A0ABQ2DQC3_9BACI|nr:hypothetical protein [Virgibacillus kapii]GGJ67619.1 hypothetical protein GCM10007111_31870 [Virgibacillus kapii]